MPHPNLALPRHARQQVRCGIIVPLVAIVLPVILILAAFAVNLSYMELTRTELRISSDAATRAAGRVFIDTNNRAKTRDAAREAGKRNVVATQALQLANSDIVFGTSERTSLNSRYSFQPGGSKPNAVQVFARRDAGSASGLVNLIIPNGDGVDTFGPVQNGISSRVELDVALVLDRSGSMAYGSNESSYNLAVAGLPPSSAPAGWAFCDAAPPQARWRDLVKGVKVFNDVLTKTESKERIALVTYNDSATLDIAPTTNYAAITSAMDGYTNSLCAGATNIGGGILGGVGAIGNGAGARSWAAKVIIVMTDGQHNIGSSPEGAARTAARNGYTVYTITFSAEAAQGRMKNLADIGGGKHFHATNSGALNKAFADIAHSLPTLLID
jgi:Mg-chelatase subunit ChlD